MSATSQANQAERPAISLSAASPAADRNGWSPRIGRLAPIGSTRALGQVAPVVAEAEHAASGAHLETWHLFTTRVRAQTGDDPHRSERWLAVVNGTRTAMRTAWTVIDPAVAATGYSFEDGPPTWTAAVGAIRDAAAALAWKAADTLTQTPAVWAAPAEEATALAYCTARAALAGADAATHGSMGELIALMLTLPEPQRGGHPS